MTLLFVCLLLVYSALSVFVVHFWHYKPSSSYPTKLEACILAPILVLHAIWLWWPMWQTGQLLLGFGHALAVLSWLTLVLYWFGGFFYRLQGLQLFLFPAAAVFLLLGYLMPNHQIGIEVNNWAFAGHILSSLLAYSLFTLSTLLAILLLWQTKHLRHHHLTLSTSFLPPLLSIEKLMFQVLVLGFTLLSVSLVTGMVFSEAVFGHAFTWTHKIIFGLVSWLIYAVILLLRWQKGIRGKNVAIAVILGFVSLGLAYLGSKFVIEIVLLRV